MTDEQLAEIEARLKAATPGNWRGNVIPPVETENGVGKPKIDAPAWTHSYVVRSVIRLSDGTTLTIFVGELFPQPGGDGDDAANNLDFIASAPTDIAALLAEVKRLRRDCAEAYQVVGYLSHKAGLFDTPSAQRALDNIAAAADGDPRPHDDLLPFPDDTKEPLEAE